MIVDETGRRIRVLDHHGRERHVDGAALQALDRGAVVVDPDDPRAGRGERAQVRVGLRLVPADVGDPNLLRSSRGRRRDGLYRLIDLGVVREVRHHLEPGVKTRHRDRGRHAVETVRPMAHDVDKVRGMCDRRGDRVV